MRRLKQLSRIKHQVSVTEIFTVLTACHIYHSNPITCQSITKLRSNIIFVLHSFLELLTLYCDKIVNLFRLYNAYKRRFLLKHTQKCVRYLDFYQNLLACLRNIRNYVRVT
jgi:hypothetical protein